MGDRGGETDLASLLAGLNPKLVAGEYVVCPLGDRQWSDLEPLRPLATFREAEAMTVVVERRTAEGAGLAAAATYKVITLSPHSSLDAVGLTAAVASALAARNIPANVFAAYYHDHILVPSSRAAEAMQALRELMGRGVRPSSPAAD